LKLAAGLIGERQVLATCGGPKLVRGDVVAIFRCVSPVPSSRTTCWEHAIHPCKCILALFLTH
jgi:hypothetical protein